MKIFPSFIGSFVRYLLKKIFPQRRRTNRKLNAGSQPASRYLNAESLEARILYSAAPVEAPAADNAGAETQPAQPTAAAETAAPTVVAPTAVAAPTTAESTPAVAYSGMQAALPASDGDSTVPADQQVVLVDVNNPATTLSDDTLQSVADAARQRWVDTGLDAEQLAALDSLTYEIAELGDNNLGSVSGTTVRIDADAGGSGKWFIDTTPDEDEEFIELRGTDTSVAIPGERADGSVDLLSVLLHEQGHVLGLGDSAINSSGLMHEFIGSGERHLPVAGQAEAATPDLDSEPSFIKLNGPLAAGENVHASFKISPDSSRVVYVIQNPGAGGLQELYSRRLDQGGIAVKLNDTLPANGSASTFFEISPDSTRVVWYGDGTIDGVAELYSRAIDGSGSQVKINNPLSGSSDARPDFEITADSMKVVWRANADDTSKDELYSRAIDGTGVQVKINDAIAAGTDILDFEVSGDSSRVVWRTGTSGFSGIELYSRAVDGTGTQVKINDPLPATAGGPQSDYAITPNSTKVVWRADGDVAGTLEIYSRNIDGSGSETKLNAALPAGGGINDFALSPDSTRVVWRGIGDTPGQREIYSRPVDGSAPMTKLNSALPAGGGAIHSGYRISPDSMYVVWRADGDTNNVEELYSAAIDTSGSEVKLNAPLPAGGDVMSVYPGLHISSDSSRVVWLADGDNDGVTELYSRAIDGSGAQVKLNDALPAGGDALNLRISGDSTTVLWTADGITDNVVELFRRAIDGSGAEARVSFPMITGGGVNTFLISPDSSRVAWTADGDTDGIQELYSARIPLDLELDGKTAADLGSYEGGIGSTFLGQGSAALQTDGKIVVASSIGNIGNMDFALTRFNVDGTVDTTFGNGGLVTTEVNSNGASFAYDSANKVFVLPDGKILATGRTSTAGTAQDDFALVRYHSDGTLDGTFGSGGMVVTDFNMSYDSAGSAVILPDGKIVVGGGSGGDFALVRYNADGSIDGTFGTAGKVTTDFNAGSNDTGYGLARQADGKLVLAGSSPGGGSTENFAAVRYNADGSIDTTFGTAGKTLIPLAGSRDRANSVAIQNDGKILLGGKSGDPSDFMVARLHTDGTLDATFGTGGKVTTDLEGSDLGHDILLQPDGKILLTGKSNFSSGDSDFGLVRYNSDGTLDTTFGNGGKETCDFFGGQDGAHTVLLDADNNIILAGRAHNGLDLDFAIVRFDSGLPVPDEPTFAGAVQLGGAGNEMGYGVATDAAGNTYSVGTFEQTADFDPGPGTFNLASAGDKDVYISKLDANQDFVWARRIGGIGTEESFNLAVDSAGNVHVTGEFSGTVDFDPGAGTHNLTSAGSRDGFVLKLDTNGDLVWVRQFQGAGRVSGQGIALDGASNVYTGGFFYQTADFDPGAGAYNLTSSGETDVFISKLDSAGNFVWARSGGGTALDLLRGLTVDQAGNVYSSGAFRGTVDFNFGGGTFNLTSAGGHDAFVSKIDTNGNFVWARQFEGATDVHGYGIKVDGAGNVFTVGNVWGTVDFDPGAGTFNLTSAGDRDAFVTKLDSSGDFVWANRMGGTGAERSNRLALGADGYIYTSGGFHNTADFDPGAGTFNLTSNGLEDSFITKLDSDGDLVWAKQIGGIGDDDAHDIHIAADNSILITGWFSDTVDFDPGAGVYNQTAAGGRDAYVLKLEQAGPAAPDETAISISGTDLVITDVLGGDTDDDLTISTNGSLITIVDNNGNTIDLGAVTGTGDGTHTVTINLTEWTGGIIYDSLDGDDRFTIDFGGGDNFSRTIIYNGGDQTLTDELLLTGGSTFIDATFHYVDENDGSIDITGNQTITYTGLEPITSTIDANNVTLNYSGASETITVTDGGGGQTTVDSTAGETTTFNHPLALLTINAGDGDDVIDLESFGAAFTAGITVAGQGDRDQITYSATGVTLTGSNAVNFNAEELTHTVGSTLTTDSGNVILTGTGASGGNATGVTLDGASISSTTGDIALTGAGGDSGHYNRGVLIKMHTGTGTASSIDTGGAVTLIGSGGSGAIHNSGVAIVDSTVTSSGSDAVTITGTGGSGTLFSEGVAILRATVNAGTGDIILNASGGSTGNMNRGANIAVSTLTSNGGSINLSGTGAGSQSYGIGIDLVKVTATTSGLGTITIDGTGASGTLANMGVRISGTSALSTFNGALDITGEANGSTLLNHGIQVASGSQIAASGSGTVTLDGTGGIGTTLNHGIQMASSSTVSVNNGKLTLTGLARGTVSLNKGIELSASTLRSSGSGDIAIMGTGSANGAGALNNGVELSADSLISTNTGHTTMTGIGGKGSSLNQGIRIIASTLQSTGAGNFDLLGQAHGMTTGVFNTGVYILGATLDSAGTFDITGTGGGGTALNHGIYMQNILPAGGVTATTAGTPGGGATSLAEAGNFF